MYTGSAVVLATVMVVWVGAGIGTQTGVAAPAASISGIDRSLSISQNQLAAVAQAVIGFVPSVVLPPSRQPGPWWVVMYAFDPDPAGNCPGPDMNGTGTQFVLDAFGATLVPVLNSSTVALAASALQAAQVMTSAQVVSALQGIGTLLASSEDAQETVNHASAHLQLDLTCIAASLNTTLLLRLVANAAVGKDGPAGPILYTANISAVSNVSAVCAAAGAACTVDPDTNAVTCTQSLPGEAPDPGASIRDMVTAIQAVAPTCYQIKLCASARGTGLVNSDGCHYAASIDAGLHTELSSACPCGVF